MEENNDKLGKAIEKAFWDGAKGSATYALTTGIQGKKIKADDALAAGVATATISFLFSMLE